MTTSIKENLENIEKRKENIEKYSEKVNALYAKIELLNCNLDDTMSDENVIEEFKTILSEAIDREKTEIKNEVRNYENFLKKELEKIEKEKLKINDETDALNKVIISSTLANNEALEMIGQLDSFRNRLQKLEKEGEAINNIINKILE